MFRQLLPYILIIILPTLLWRGAGGEVLAQNYPIQLTTQLIPPYSSYLPDYETPGNEKLRAIILLKDLTKPIYAVRLTLKVEGQGFAMQTKPYFKSIPVSINAGLPTEVSADVLAQLLDSKNLDFSGISRNDYEQRKVLPEGYYKICLIAYDAYNPNNIQVSNESCASAWMTLSDPPQLNLPFCGTTIALFPPSGGGAGAPQQVTFNWTPMNMGSPNSAQNTEYLFELWEIHPDGANPNNVVQTLQPVYSTTTDFTTLNYGITETPLVPGLEYAWRVRAKDKNGYDNFKNKGYSAVCNFRYGSKYDGLGNAVKLNLTAIPLTAHIANLSWDSLPIYYTYTVNYRKQGWPDWFETATTNASAKAYDLEPLTAYEARVQGVASDGFISPWSNTVVFKTPGLASYACGDPPPTTTPQNMKPLPAAQPGMTFQVGQFEMFVTEITGSNGYYSGMGKISVPFAMTNLSVGFNNIYVNEDRTLVMGEVKAVSEGLDKWLQDKEVSAAEDNTTYIEGHTDSVVVKNGKACIYANGGKQAVECDDVPKGGLAVKDGEGNEYVVLPDGTIIKKEYLEISTDTLDASDSLKVEFKASPTQQYGFDEKQYAAWASDYEVIKLKNNKNYFVPYKGVAEGQSDEVIANVIVIGGSGSGQVDASGVSFKTLGGQDISSTSIGSNQFKLTVPADAQSVYAFYMAPEDTRRASKKIGKLNIVNLKPLSRKIVIVPVNGATASGNIEQELNTIYKQANVSWTVSTAQNFNYSYDANNNGLEMADATLMTKYSPEMRALRDAYKKDSSYDKNAYYLFAVNKFSDNAVRGYMVRGRAVGFIAAGANVATIAHELGHGAFGLEHTFPAIEKGKTNDLMDYGTGSNLNKKQWDLIHSNMPVFNWMDDEEDGALEKATEDLHSTIEQVRMAYIKNTAIELRAVDRGALYFATDCEYSYGVKVGADFFVKIRGCLSNPVADFFEPHKDIQIKGNSVVMGPFYFETASSDEATKLFNYITNNTSKRNILLFVNGFRLEDFLSKGPDEVWDYDKYNYWSGIDLRFVYRIGTRNVVYADGHDAISTSMHESYIAAATNDPGNIYKPNIQGFNKRTDGGKIAAYNFLTKLQNGTINCRKDADGNIIDTLDIVCHSMGYAYSLGMIEVLKTKIYIGRYYIIAPENPGLGYVPDDLEKVWHYGSDETKEKDDHIAKQSLISYNDKNEFIRAKRPTELGWAASHYIKNYEWIFDKTQTERGYVQKR